MRNIFFPVAFLCLIMIGIITYFWHGFAWVFVLFFPLLGLGIYDYFQTGHTIRRNFPLLGRMRYMFEQIRPEIHQYFVETDTGGRPFNRLQRDMIYQRSKDVRDTVPFGTQMNVYEPGYEWVNHSILALRPDEIEHHPRVRIGSSQCSEPYDASLFNISAMSYGSLSKNAILALNAGAKIGGFYHNTGEGGLSHYHLEPGGDIVWNIGTGYFSCRNKDGSFSESEFQKRATLPNVKMIEIKFSQGAKPGHGGILPKEKVTEEIAGIRLVQTGEDIVSPPRHSSFSTPIELMHFAQKLRQLSGGKPVGIKICIGQKSEFISICKAMIKTNILLDFITVDGGEGGTGAAPPEFSNSVGMPLRDAVAFVYDMLKGFGLKKEIKIICSGKIISGFDIIKALSIGADLCNSARGMMMALGCIQALKCNANTCPTGVATQKPELMNGLVVEDKKERVANYHKDTILTAVELMAAAGLDHPDKVDRKVVHRRIDDTNIETFEETYPEYPEKCMLDENNIPKKYRLHYQRASAEHF